jgi:hypothetical protein
METPWAYLVEIKCVKLMKSRECGPFRGTLGGRREIKEGDFRAFLFPSRRSQEFCWSSLREGEGADLAGCAPCTPRTAPPRLKTQSKCSQGSNIALGAPA